ncbi:MAG: MFS transporter [Bacteroides sp.]|nr:MFS transporter [Bacteroides sp.]MDD2645082.1 MFS transporter [Bacteroides sp.]MDD4054271.1 MFS transporter [Bacteroides sp.]MDD4719925.1 MFS transporter [Bacteroides sp.]NLI64020.1 sugar MFS transporter [Bacteroidales bacterium]
MENNKNNILVLIPIMLCFFAMGFVDLVGIASNYVKEDFNLSDTNANLLPSMVFFWFLVCSVPTGLLMNKIGRKKTVLLSLIVTVVALILPIVNYSYPMMLLSFAFLGIGNAIMQVSLNPLLTNVIKADKLASMLTFGQFVKAIASFSAPIVAGWAAFQFDNWKLLYPIFMLFAIIAVIGLGITTIEEEQEEGKTSGFIECFSLLGDKMILLCFVGIMCHVGIDVGTNVTAPKILMERLSIPLSEAGYATSIYFLFRLIGCLSGTFILAKYSSKKFFAASATLIALGLIGLSLVDSKSAIYISVALIGYGNSNIFPIIFSQALMHLPNKKNEVSGLMIMGLIGGAIFPVLMGGLSDAMSSQIGAIIVMIVGSVYLLSLITKIQHITSNN